MLDAIPVSIRQLPNMEKGRPGQKGVASLPISASQCDQPGCLPGARLPLREPPELLDVPISRVTITPGLQKESVLEGLKAYQEVENR